MNSVKDQGIGSDAWGVNYTRVPIDVYIDADIFEQEQENIYRGKCWHLLGLECEVPNAGDYITTYIGTTPDRVQPA